MTDARNNALLLFAGIVVSLAADVLLASQWLAWSHSPWADCPNYAFSQTWYPEPPLPVTLVPLALAASGIVFFAVRLSASQRNRQPLQSLACVMGLTLNCLPFVAALVIPGISDLLQMSRAGC